MLHILAGNSDEDVGSVLKRPRVVRSVSWIVPKKARLSDRALFHLPSLGFAARGVIDSEPEQDEPGRYGASVNAVTLLSSAVPLAFIRKNHLHGGGPPILEVMLRLMVPSRRGLMNCSTAIRHVSQSR